MPERITATFLIFPNPVNMMIWKCHPLRNVPGHLSRFRMDVTSSVPTALFRMQGEESAAENWKISDRKWKNWRQTDIWRLC